MDYYKIDIKTDPAQFEVLTAFLAELPFEAFEEQPDSLVAYLPALAFSTDFQQELQQLADQRDFTYESTFIPYRNWNEEWESNFQPITVDDFCSIRADFHPPNPDTSYEIIINPRMAFGTGHHETTYMMISQMQKLDSKDLEVFDYGCGTGVLAILAAQQGATRVDAIDIEEPAYENTLDNAQLNKVASKLHIQLGSIELVAHKQYDLILANINRNVILNSLPTLYKMMKTDSLLLISGLLLEDENLVSHHISDCGFSIIDRQQRNNWLCMSLKR